jgi:hypothetical protein
MSECPYCRQLFLPKRRWAAFCSKKCRNGYDQDMGAQGRVASVRRLKVGVSVVVHLTGPAAERALNLELRQLVRVTGKP